MSHREASTNYEEKYTLKELLQKIGEWYNYLVSKWVTIILLAIAGGISGFIYFSFQKPVYRAITTFVLEESDKAGGGLAQYAGLASMAGIDLGGGGGGLFQGDNIPELYKSRSMIEKTLLTEVKFGGKPGLLIDAYIDFNQLKEKWAKKNNIHDVHFLKMSDTSFRSSRGNGRVQDSLLGTIVKDINKNYLEVSKPDKKLNIIQVEVKSKNEAFAKMLNEQLVENVNDFYIQTKTKKQSASIAILQHKTDSVLAVLNGAIFSAASIVDATPNLNSARQAQRIAPVQRSQVTTETNKAVLSELKKNLELSKLNLLKETPLIQVVDAPILPLEIKRISPLIGCAIGMILGAFLTVFFLLIRKTVVDTLK